MSWMAERSGGVGRSVQRVALDRRAVGLFDGAEAGGYPGLAGGDGLAVLSAVGAFGQVLAVAFYFAEVGFAFAGVGGEGEDGGAGGGGVQDEADGPVSGSWRARAMTGGPSVSGQAGAGAAVPSQVRWRRSASMRSARSIWWQAAPKFSPIGPRRVLRLAQ